MEKAEKKAREEAERIAAEMEQQEYELR